LNPRLRTYLSASLVRGQWTASAAQNWQSGHDDPADSQTGATRRVESYETYDLQTLYAALKGLKLILGVKNILNRATRLSPTRKARCRFRPAMSRSTPARVAASSPSKRPISLNSPRRVPV